jgi:hypothetical protein
MTLELLTAPESGLLGTPPSGFKLRLAGPHRESRILDVQPSKCTIGAAADCTIRLDDTGLYPLHCLILRGAAATIVRRYSPVTRLNGRDFAEAVLKPGDRLAVADYEIEILPADAVAASVSTGRSRPRFANEREIGRQQELLARQAADLAAARQAFQERLRRLESEKAHWIADRQAIDEERSDWRLRQQELQARLTAQEQEAATHAQALTRSQANLAALERLLSEERAAWNARGQELESRLAEHQTTAGELARSSGETRRLLADLKSAQQALEAERGDGQRQQQELAARLAAHEREAAQQAEAVDRLQRTLAEERANWQVRSQELEARLAEQSLAAEDSSRLSEEIERLSADLNRAQQALDAERGGWQIRQQELEARLTAHEREAVQQAEAVDRLQRTLAEERANWQLRRQELEARLAEQTHAAEDSSRSSEEIERLSADLNRAQQALDAERGGWQLRQQELEARLAAHEREAVQQAEALERLARTDTDLAALERTLAEERANWQLRRQELEARLADQEVTRLSQQSMQEIADLRGELEATRQLLADERTRWQADLEIRQNEAADSAAEAEARGLTMQLQLVQLTNELEAARRGLDEDRRQWEDLRQRQQADLARQSREFEPTPSEIEPGAAASDEANAAADPTVASAERLLGQYGEPSATDVAFEAPAADAPVTTADLLSRFGLSLDRDEPEEAASIAAEPEPVVSEPAEMPAATRSSHGHHDEEDSIDVYMAQLMARLGNPSYTAPREEPSRPAVVVQTLPDEVEPVEPELPRAPKLRDPSEMARRAAAPERSTDLSAMREIANFNARSAIDKHYRRTVFHSWLNKAMVTLVALLSAAFHAWFALEGHPSAFYLALLSLVVAIFWGWQYAHVAKTLADSRGTVTAESGTNRADAEPADSAS